MIDKTARKSSSDPVQEKLRLDKATWNKAVSAFIDDLISLKKLMNGVPNKFYSQKSWIQNPVPADPNTILGALAGDFSELAHKGQGLVEQQLEYSKKRRQKQNKQPSNHLSEQLAASSLPPLLIAEGSNPVSRFFSSFRTPWFGQSRLRKYRLSFLRGAASLNSQLKKFESDIVGSSSASVFAAEQTLLKIDNQLSYLQSSLVAFQQQENSQNLNPLPEASEPPKSPEIVNPVMGEAKAAVEDFRRAAPNFTDLDPAMMRHTASLILKFLGAISAEEKEDLAMQVVNAHRELLNKINAKRGTEADSLVEILLDKKTAAQQQLQKVAQNAVSRWLGKLKHQINPFDQTSAVRLDLFNLAQECRKELNQLMDSLEKEVVVEKIDSVLQTIRQHLNQMLPLMEVLTRQQIVHYQVEPDKQQRERLLKMFETRRLRNLTNTLSKK